MVDRERAFHATSTASTDRSTTAKGLTMTDEQIDATWREVTLESIHDSKVRFARAIEAAATAPLLERIAELEAENTRLEWLVYSPGLWRCAKCKFTLVQRNLNANSGTVTARDQPGDKCPNCDVNLWRVTERENALENYEAAESLQIRLNALEAKLAQVPDGWQLVPDELTREMWAAVNKVDDSAFAGGSAHGADFESLWYAALAASPQPQPVQPSESFQQRVKHWLRACFGEMIAGDKEERNHRFLEEALELVQACGCTEDEARQLVGYVYGRPVGEPPQEVGGVMVTLAALCLAHGMDMHISAEIELARIWTKVEQIRAKQAAKPKHSPLPMVVQAKPEQAAQPECTCLTGGLGPHYCERHSP